MVTQTLKNAPDHPDWERIPTPEDIDEKALSDFLKEQKWKFIQDDEWENPYTKVIQTKATALMTEIQKMRYKLEQHESN